MRTVIASLIMLVACSTAGPPSSSGTQSGSTVDCTQTPNDPSCQPPDACQTDPNGRACYCEQHPGDCQSQGQPQDPCQTDPNGDACYCEQNATDPYCQGQGQTQDPCQTDPNGDACYCEQNATDPYCQGA